MERSFIEVYNFLRGYDLLKDTPFYWWPNALSFEVVVGAILTQNTSWSNVERSLDNLQGYLSLERFVVLEEEDLKQRIRPSGFYNQKAPRLLTLAKNIQSEFGSFENFQKNVTRGWLLAQRGIGKESADAILCYGCGKEVMVIDSYTKRVLERFGIVFCGYDGYKSYIEHSVEQNWEIFAKDYQEDRHLFFCHLQ